MSLKFFFDTTPGTRYGGLNQVFILSIKHNRIHIMQRK